MHRNRPERCFGAHWQKQLKIHKAKRGVEFAVYQIPYPIGNAILIVRRKVCIRVAGKVYGQGGSVSSSTSPLLEVLEQFHTYVLWERLAHKWAERRSFIKLG
jgi:hypothetical protein